MNALARIRSLASPLPRLWLLAALLLAALLVPVEGAWAQGELRIQATQGWRLDWRPPAALREIIGDSGFNACVVDPNSEECQRNLNEANAGAISQNIWEGWQVECYTCYALYPLAVSFDFYGKRGYVELAELIRRNNLLELIVLLYVMLQLMRLFVPLDSGRGPGPLHSITVAFMVYLFAGAMLHPSTRGMVFEYFTDPFIDASIRMATTIMDQMVTMCEGSGAGLTRAAEYTYGGPGLTARIAGNESIQPIDPQIVNGMMCVVHNIQRLAGLGITAGWQVATSTNIGVADLVIGFGVGNVVNILLLFFYFAHGAVLIFKFGYLMFVIGFYIIDIFVRMMLLVLSLPLTMMAVVIPSLRSWFFNVLKGLFASSLGFVFSAMIFTVAGAVLCNVGQSFGSPEAGQVFVNADERGRWGFTILDPAFWMLLMVPILTATAFKRGQALADQIVQTGGIGGGSEMAKRITGMAQTAVALVPATAALAATSAARNLARKVPRRAPNQTGQQP